MPDQLTQEFTVQARISIAVGAGDSSVDIEAVREWIQETWALRTGTLTDFVDRSANPRAAEDRVIALVTIADETLEDLASPERIAEAYQARMFELPTVPPPPYRPGPCWPRRHRGPLGGRRLGRRFLSRG